MKTLITIIAAALFAITANAQVSKDFSFTDQSDNEDGFIVMRQVGDAEPTQLLTLDAGVTAFTDPDIPLGETINWWVYAWNAYGDSANTNIVTIVTMVPNGPSDLKVLKKNPIARFWRKIKGKKRS